MHPSDVPSSALDADGDSRVDDPFRIAFGIDNRRNRQLLADLLSEFETTEATAPIPEGTDLCIVDTDGFGTLQEAIAEWKDAERPATAPVLLLTTDSAEKAWSRYGDAVGDLLDGIQPIPSPQRAILARVDSLLETRRHSLASRNRQRELELYKRAMDGAGIGITIVDASAPDLPMVYANEGFLDVTGYTREEALGRNCRFLQGPDTDEGTVQRIREALAAEEPVSVEIRNYRKNGDPFWNALDIMPVTDDAGDVTHFLGFQQDVTERKQREQLLEQYEQIVQSVDDPIFVLNRDGHVVDTNGAAEQVFAVDGALPAGTPVADLLDEEGAERFREAIEATTDDGSLTREIAVDENTRKTVYQFRFQRVVIDTDDPVDRIIAIGRDITRIREYQDRLSVLDRVLRHNLRNKLNVVSGQSQFLAEHADQLPIADIRDIGSTIDTAATDLLELADAVRQFNRNVDPERVSASVVDVAELVRELIEELREAHPNTSIDIEAPPSTAAVCPSTIQLCIERLVDNAAEYADDSDPRVRIEITDDPSAEWVELAVVDNGDGFPEVEQRALTSGAETSMEHIQGISLWLVRWAVTNVGGRLDIRAAPDGGAMVVLRLRKAERSPAV